MTDPEVASSASRRHLREVVGVMLKLGTIAFGGPAVHVAMLREEAVRRHRWLEDEEFLDLFAAVSVLPGPSSTQLAIALSRRRAGWAGLVLGGACFIGPAMAIVLVLAWAYDRYGTTPTGAGVLYGVAPVVIAIVALALWNLARTALKRRWFLAIAAAAIAAYFMGITALVPLLGGGAIVAIVDNRHRLRNPGAPLLWLPFLPAVPGSVSDTGPRIVDILLEFLKLGVVVFGSGYVLLAYLRADLVNGLHWLTEEQVLAAISAGQITPGPVFTTATFVGYLIGGVPGALVATAGIFVPSFVMVALVEPRVAALRRSPWLGPALDGIAVAAVGLMAAVTVDLARATILDPLRALIALGSLALLLRFKTNSLWLIAAGALIGIVRA